MPQRRRQLAELRKTLPPGYSIIVSGEQAKQVQGFKNLTVMMAVSIALIFLALAFQFRHSVKPFWCWPLRHTVLWAR